MDKIKFARTAITVVLGIIAIAALGLVVFFVYRAGMPANVDNAGGGLTPSYSDHFNGEIPEVYPPIGVMIENQALARPFQKGLSRAAVVYEAPAEANITRFLAIFPADTANAVSGADDGTSGGTGANMAGVFYPEKFGPVRSARVYFLDWMHEYNGIYVHVGGRYDALARLQKENIIDVDQFLYDAQFKRENIGRTALEHTMFTTGAALQKLIEGKIWIWGRVSHPLLERDGDTIKLPVGAGGANGGAAKKIIIDFGHSSYEANYEYDAAADRYKRSQHGVAHIDQLNGEQIAPEIIIVQRVNAWSNNDAAVSIGMKTVDNGDAIIFAHGQYVEATWKKESPNEPTRFFYKDSGREISFGAAANGGKNAGPVWVEIVPLYNSISYQ